MPRGSKPNRPPDAGAALLAAANLDTAERLSPLSVLRQRLAEYTALAATAKAAQDMAEYRIWSERSAQAARDLLPYEPPDQGSRVTRFPLLIFDSQRRPLELEVRQSDNVAARSAEPKADASEVVAGEVLPTSKETPKPEAPPTEAPSPDEAASDDALAWRRSQQWCAYFGTGRRPCGSRHRW